MRFIDWLNVRSRFAHIRTVLRPIGSGLRHPAIQWLALSAGFLLLSLLALTAMGQSLVPTDLDTARYLLSAILQSLSAVAAVYFTLSLVGVQFLASNYSPRLLGLLTSSWWFWAELGLFVVAISFTAGVLAGINDGQLSRFAIGLVELVSALCLFSLFPLTWGVLRFFTPERVATEFLNRVNHAYWNRLEDRTDLRARLFATDPFYQLPSLVEGLLSRGDRALPGRIIDELRYRIRHPEVDQKDASSSRRVLLQSVIVPFVRSIGGTAVRHRDGELIGRLLWLLRDIHVPGAWHQRERDALDYSDRHLPDAILHLLAESVDFLSRDVLSNFSIVLSDLFEKEIHSLPNDEKILMFVQIEDWPSDDSPEYEELQKNDIFFQDLVLQYISNPGSLAMNLSDEGEEPAAQELIVYFSRLLRPIRQLPIDSRARLHLLSQVAQEMRLNLRELGHRGWRVPFTLVVSDEASELLRTGDNSGALTLIVLCSETVTAAAAGVGRQVTALHTLRLAGLLNTLVQYRSGSELLSFQGPLLEAIKHVGDVTLHEMKKNPVDLTLRGFFDQAGGQFRNVLQSFRDEDAAARKALEDVLARSWERQTF